jgi:hypothetical protein
MPQRDVIECVSCQLFGKEAGNRVGLSLEDMLSPL